jgi:ketosteroid isomerase-like protein
MTHYAIRLSVTLATFFIGIAATNFLNILPFGTTPHGDAERGVLKVEREYVRAYLERDVAALERVLADDFTSFRGRVKKEHRLALLANPLFTVTSLSTEDVSIRVSGDVAFLSGSARMTGSFRGHEFASPRYGFVRRLELREGRWQIVSCEFSFARFSAGN